MRALSLMMVLFLLWGCSDDTANTNTNNANNTANNTANNANNNTNNATNNVVDPCVPNPCSEGRACTVRDGQPRCGCPAGSHDDNGVCAPDTACTETTCSGFGTCTADQTTLSCLCDAGYAGDFCENCAAGYLRDPQTGGCTNDPCDLLSCGGDQVCVADGLMAECACPAGTHAEGNECVIDETCSATTCNGQGTCDDSTNVVVCACDPGYAGLFCTECDLQGGYHDDGNGGCTTDVCVPNPCGAPNRGLCAADTTSPTGYACSCNAGFHDEGGSCVVDQTCVANTCNQHGTCDDTGGVVTCDCTAGYAGDRCDTCDSASGYHDDGNGGCTNDACTPNPCDGPNKTTCVAGQASYTCTCDPGYHADGNGGCTNDPCLPDVCAAQNKACRVTNNQAECYTPDCDDRNPCTQDVLVMGACQHTALSNGTACTIDVCTTGATCQAGQCAGGVARTCNDTNPCTDDTCVVAQGGCVFTNDDTNVPSDGVACTTDTCTSGVASHVPNNAACDDTLWCTGVEVCQPTNLAANANGCVTTNVPQPPANPSPCQTYGVCNEATQSFVLNNLAQGSACNDGVLCTTNDRCNAQGQCVGTLGATCDLPDGPAACTTTHAMASVLNIPVAYPTVDVTLNGQDLNAMNPAPYYDFSIWAVSQTTGTWHSLAYYSYNYTAPNRVVKTSRTPPGVYDIYYSGSSASDTYYGRTSANQLIPYGKSILQKDVVIPAGPSQLSFDIKPVEMTVDVTYDGQDLNAMNPAPYYDFSIWAVNKDTGAFHSLAYYSYNYTPPNRVVKTARILPGTYDIWYSGSSASDTYFGRTSANQQIPYGKKILQKNVTFTGASASYAVDIKPIALNVDVTVGGVDLNAANPAPYYDFSIWAVDNETGAFHSLAYYSYNYTAPNRVVKTTKILPGTYDIWYSGSSASDTYFGRTSANQQIPYGKKILRKGVVFSTAQNSLNIDVPVVPVNVDVTLNGQDLNTLNPAPYYDFSIWAVDKETGAFHSLAYYSYNYTPPNRVVKTTKIVPGTYDIWYSGSSASDTYFGRTSANQLIPYGKSRLQENVVISAMQNTVSVDLKPVDVTINVAHADVDLNGTTAPYYDFSVWAVDQTTGAFHSLAYYSYNYTAPNRVVKTARILPGTYDIWYSGSSASDTYFGRTSSNQLIPYGKAILKRDVVISPASNTVDVVIDPSAITPDVRLEGDDLNALNPAPYYDFSVWAVSTATGAWHSLMYYSYNYTAPNRVVKNTKLMPGTYNLVYGTSGSDTYYGRSSANQRVPYGQMVLDTCVQF